MITVAAWLAATRPALADGTIVTTDAEIASGEGSPRGRTIVDELAPPARQPEFAPRPFPAPLPELVSDIPPLGETGDGQQDFVATSGTTRTLSAGAHDFASFTVQEDASVECLGPVTIRVTGSVSIQGAVTSSADGALITFLCGGNFAMGTGPSGASPSIETLGSSAPVTIDVSWSVSCDAADGSVRSAGAGVTLRQRGYSSTLVLRGVEVASGGGAVSVKSYGSIALTNASVSASGDIDLYAFNGVLDVTNAEISASGALRARSRSQLSFTDVAATSAGAVDVMAVQDRIYLTRSSVETTAGSAGDLSVRSSRHVYLSRSTLRHRGTGSLHVLALEILLEYPQFSAASYVLHEGDGDVRFVLNGMLITYGRSAVVASHGNVRVYGSHVEANGDALFSAVAGSLEFDLDRSIRLRASTTGGPEGLPDLEAGKIRIAVAQEEVALAVDRADVGFGGLDVSTAGRIVLRGIFTSVGPVTLRATFGTIDVAGADVSTAAASGRATAPIVMETFYAYEGSIVATGARIRSGDATAGRSGDVVLAAHAPYWYGSGCGECPLEDGAAPGYVQAIATGAHTVRLSWMPRDREGTGFVVERATGAGPFEVMATLGPDDVHLVDENLAPDTEYGYRVSVLIGVVTSSPSNEVRVRTKSNIGVRVSRATVVDKKLLRTDTVAIALKLRFLERPADEAFDPRAAPLRIYVGNAFYLFVPANDARWSQQGRRFVWTGPVGFDGEATVRVDPASGRLDVKAKGFGVVQPDADRSFVRVSAGADAGSKSLRKRARR